MSVLRAALEENVKRVVVTSSAITIIPYEQEAKTYSEKDWIDAESVLKSSFSGYQKSKILAERAAWNFYEENKKKGKCFELATVLPTLTMGPVLSAQSRSSVSVVLTLFNKNVDKVDNFVYPVCDVRDVALAHVRAAQLEEAIGKRFIIVLSKKSIPLSAVGEILRENGYKVADVKEKEYADICVDDSNLRNILKIEPTELRKSVLDMCESLVSYGVIEK